MIRANKTLKEYLKELNCTESFYYKVLGMHNITAGYQLSDKINNYDLQFNNFIAFDCWDIYPGITHQIYRFRYDYVEISSLEKLTSILNRCLNLKAFI